MVSGTVQTVTQPADDILALLDTDNWFKDDDKAKLNSVLVRVLEAVASPDTSRSDKEQALIAFLRELWQNYDLNIVAELLKEFSELESALAPLVLTGKSRYRDHFTHMFNTYIFGAIILSLVAASDVEDTVLQELLKVSAESSANFPFHTTGLHAYQPYSIKKRLFFIWTMMAAVHDVAMPLSLLGDVVGPFSKYAAYFGLSVGGLEAVWDYATSARMGYYIRLMARMFADGVRLSTNSETGEPDGNYVLAPEVDPSFVLEMDEAVDKRVHGVLGAVCLFRSVEQAFLIGTAPSVRSPRDYVRAILEQDITRSALAIALHSVDPKQGSRLVPIEFCKLPLAFLLVLCDELQEFYRTEYFSSVSGMREIEVLNEWPIPDVEVQKDPPKLVLRVKLRYPTLSEEDKNTILQEYNAKFEGTHHVSSYEEFVAARGRSSCERLQKKLALKTATRGHGEGKSFEIGLCFCYRAEESRTVLID